MQLKDKVLCLLKQLKNSYWVVYNGNPCLYNEHETYENKNGDIPNKIVFDDDTGDDYYAQVKLDNLKDIEIVNGKFKLIYFDDTYSFIGILIIKRCYFQDK